MKKIKLTLLTLALVIGICGAFAFKTPVHHEKKFLVLYWYPVNTAGQIAGPHLFSDAVSKAAAIAGQDCKDSPNQPVCLYGDTDPELLVGTSIGSPNSGHAVLKSN
ncbi:hypothetical protein SAMN05428975_4267 [Mucilaginibacter sp. OK268]|uniref:hypothetical protein n=1 Tax=Mucilaginibacter sp. OK268 TaxID=1881048 RepID=UPI0008854276|nr:hypothetical protein [Mucilaginibacter sp. OK268]SDP96555.1 hypothetical protein SAMN05428975_4267 [Mucilaginibacter sp. OK268]